MMIPRLVKLTLVNVSEEIFRHPCRLPSLKTLRLENIELLDHLSEDWLRDLASLEELHIGSCPSLVSISRGMMHLENLVSLSIWNCKELDLSKDEQGNVMMDPQGPKRLKFLTIYKASKMEYLQSLGRVTFVDHHSHDALPIPINCIFLRPTIISGLAITTLWMTVWEAVGVPKDNWGWLDITWTYARRPTFLFNGLWISLKL